ncbi:MAG: cell division protein FtsQ/DivIB [Congregibacter sp.]
MAVSRRNARRQPPTTRARLRGMVPAMRKVGQSLVSLCAMVLLIALASMAFEALRGLSVERIVVTGKLEHLRQEAVREALTPDLANGLLLMNLSELRDKLEALPWVYRAELRRRFPDTLEVYVVEQLPIARWGDGAFLNHQAFITEVTDAARWQDLPQIRGPEGSEARLMNDYQRLLDQLRPLALTPVALHEDEFGQLRARLDNGLELHLGDHDFALRVQRFQQLWRRELQDAGSPIARVDMRYDGGAAVTFAHTPQLAVVTTNSGSR